MASELEGLIHFWKEHLSHNRHIMSPSIIWQVEQTINFLEELKKCRVLKLDALQSKSERLAHGPMVYYLKSHD